MGTSNCGPACIKTVSLIENCISWGPDPYSIGLDVLQQKWSNHLGNIVYAFPPFSLIPRVLNKVIQDQTHTDSSDTSLANSELVLRVATNFHS